MATYQSPMHWHYVCLIPVSRWRKPFKVALITCLNTCYPSSVADSLSYCQAPILGGWLPVFLPDHLSLSGYWPACQALFCNRLINPYDHVTHCRLVILKCQALSITLNLFSGTGWLTSRIIKVSFPAINQGVVFATSPLRSCYLLWAFFFSLSSSI